MTPWELENTKKNSDLFKWHTDKENNGLYLEAVVLLVPVAATAFFRLLPYLVMGTCSSSWGLGFW